MKKRVLLSAGGTGGHLFPAQAIADRLGECEILFVGGNLSKNKYFNQKKYPFKDIKVGTFSLKGAKKIVVGYVESLFLLRKWKPDVVLGFGSYYTFPCLLAAKTLGIPIILHEQNSIPGKVNRLFSKIARFTAITFPSSRAYLKGKVVEVEFPLRFPCIRKEKKESFAYFGLDPNKKTVLAFGGSQGGSGINRLLFEMAIHLPKEWQILHFTGNKDAKEKGEKIYKEMGLSATVKEFEPQMEHAWNVADVALCRAGASTIVEATVWEVPAILIPFPYASERHQDRNAEHFVYYVKGGVLFFEDNASGSEICTTLKSMDLETLKTNISKYKQQKKCQKLEELI